MKAFAPLESNPDVFNEFLGKLDIDSVEFVDVYGLDPELLAFVPRPVRAVLLVFPVSKTYEAYRESADANYEVEKNPAIWSKQTIKNACGTMALIHALANGVSPAALGSGSGHRLITEFQQASDRPQFLESNALLEQIHSSVANQGTSDAVDADEEVDSHYVCLTKHGDDLVELDGRRKGPIVREHNVANPDLLAIPRAIETIKEFIDRESGSPSFAMLALVDKN